MIKFFIVSFNWDAFAKLSANNFESLFNNSWYICSAVIFVFDLVSLVKTFSIVEISSAVAFSNKLSLNNLSITSCIFVILLLASVFITSFNNSVFAWSIASLNCGSAIICSLNLPITSLKISLWLNLPSFSIICANKSEDIFLNASLNAGLLSVILDKLSIFLLRFRFCPVIDIPEKNKLVTNAIENVSNKLSTLTSLCNISRYEFSFSSVQERHNGVIKSVTTSSVPSPIPLIISFSIIALVFGFFITLLVIFPNVLLYAALSTSSYQPVPKPIIPENIHSVASSVVADSNE